MVITKWPKPLLERFLAPTIEFSLRATHAAAISNFMYAMLLGIACLGGFGHGVAMAIKKKFGRHREVLAGMEVVGRKHPGCPLWDVHLAGYAIRFSADLYTAHYRHSASNELRPGLAGLQGEMPDATQSGDESSRSRCHWH